jgi:hypothetical protein
MSNTSLGNLGNPEGFRGHLALLLASIEANDLKYEARYALIFHAISTALRAGLRAGVRFDSREPDWPIAFIELPSGQVSWHLPQHARAWDGHTTAEKYSRCRRFIDTVCG